MPTDALQARQEEQARPQSPARREMVVALAILNITGVLVTIGAAAVLMLNDETDQRWWWAVGLASLLAVFTTVLLIGIEGRRRTFIKVSERLAEDLESLAQQNEEHSQRSRQRARRRLLPSARPAGREPDQLPDDLQELARARRNAALASGDLAIADRLTLVLARLR